MQEIKHTAEFLGSRINNVEKRLDNVETKLDEVSGDVSEIKAAVVGHDKKIKKLEKESGLDSDRFPTPSFESRGSWHRLSTIFRQGEERLLILVSRRSERAFRALHDEREHGLRACSLFSASSKTHAVRAVHDLVSDLFVPVGGQAVHDNDV